MIDTERFEALKGELGVDDFSEIREDHTLAIGKFLAGSDYATALQLVSAIPDLTKILAGTVQKIADAFHESIVSNNDSMRVLYENYSKTLDAYLDELKNSPSDELKAEILLKINELNQMASKKDSENKEFLQKQNDGLYKILGAIAGGLLTIGAGYVAYNKYQESHKSFFDRVLDKIPHIK